MYPGASQYAEDHPKMVMLGKILAKIGYKIYIPRIPPLKILDISDVNIQWFSHFYKWLLNEEKIEPQEICMVGISYGGGLMLKTLLNIKQQLPPPKTILTYGTYSDAGSTLNFFLTGEISINNEESYISPHEWGLIVIFQNYLKNLNLVL